jgi:hypothetical protein
MIQEWMSWNLKKNVVISKGRFLLARIRHEDIGDVFYRDFDIGVYRTLLAEQIGDRYYLSADFVPDVIPPLFSEFTGPVSQQGTQMPGVPVTFGNPSTAVVRYLLPCIRIKREDPSPALERWQSSHDKYRRPASGEDEITIDYRGREVKGYRKYEEQPGSITSDIPYTITCEGVGKSARAQAEQLLGHCMKYIYPHEKIWVLDSLGNMRGYQSHCEGPSELTAVADIRDRSVIYALSLRVQGEIDVRDPVEKVAVTSIPEVSLDHMFNVPE